MHSALTDLWQMICSAESYQSRHWSLRGGLCGSHDQHGDVHIPSFGMFSFDIVLVMSKVKVVWLTCEHGTEMGTPLPVLNKHRKLSPVSGEGRPELIVRVI